MRFDRFSAAVLTLAFLSGCAQTGTLNRGSDLRAYIGGWDTDGDGSLSRAEFDRSISFEVTHVRISKQEADEMFSKYDSDGDGFIGVDELKALRRVVRHNRR